MNQSNCNCQHGCKCQGNDTVAVIGALLLGAAVGAALGILFAPDKGSNTRSKLYNKAADLADELKNKMQGNTGKEENPGFEEPVA
jgi:gas vesicle protein